MRFLSSAILFLGLAFLPGCSPGSQNNRPGSPPPQYEKENSSKKGGKDNEPSSSAKADPSAASTSCDKSLWDHVYNPDRLEVEKDCMTVSGTITERSTDEDGDEHMLLKLDDGQDDLLTKKNKKKKDDNLVIEAVCAGKTALKKVGDACKHFSNSVQLPQVGDHVLVTGSYVLDSHNGWTEIHPITSIERK